MELVVVDAAAVRKQQADAEPAEAHLDPRVQHAHRVVEDLGHAAVALAGETEPAVSRHRKVARHGQIEHGRHE